MDFYVNAIHYDHDMNRALHTTSGAQAVLETLFPEQRPASMLDVACGAGTWLRAALDLGVQRVQGIEGIELSAEKLYVSKERIQIADLNQEFDLRQEFDLVICLEAAEHLEPSSAQGLVRSIARHGSRVLFSAASPGQAGTHHVNCQWPEYWQDLFNENGFSCDDSIRWRIWEDSRIEPWYRQNLFEARRDPQLAGREPRLMRVVHPDLLPSFSEMFLPGHRTLIESGAMPWTWYVAASWKAAISKLSHRFGG